MDDNLLNTLLGQGLAIMLVVGAGIFIWRELWPYLRIRDEQQRHRHFEIETAYVGSIKAAADAQVLFARVMDNLCKRGLSNDPTSELPDLSKFDH